MSDVTLLDCPHCCSSDLQIFTYCGDVEETHVACNACHCRGPVSQDYESALTWWNLRDTRAMDALQELYRDVQEELSDTDALRERLAFIIAGVTAALKGPAKPKTGHSWHDLAEVALSTKIEANRFLACRMGARTMPEDGGEEAFIAAIDQYIADHM